MIVIYKIKLILILIILFLFSISSLRAQEEKERPFYFYLDVHSGKVVHDPITRQRSPTATGVDLGVGVGLEKQLLQNITASFALYLDYFALEPSYYYIFSTRVNREFIRESERQGLVNIRSGNIRLPLRFRLHYLSKPRFRFFLEPGLFLTVPVVTRFKDDFWLTRYYDESSDTVISPPQRQLIQETYYHQKVWLGFGTGVGFLWRKEDHTAIILSIEYLRSRFSVSRITSSRANTWRFVARYRWPKKVGDKEAEVYSGSLQVFY